MSTQANTRIGTALVIGISGGIGGEIARALHRRGWQIRALGRRPMTEAQVAMPEGSVTWRVGDALKEADVVSAAQGCSVIVHAVNPPGYHNWRGLVMPMLNNTIAAARATGARILFPGTIYNYGPDAGTLLNEDSPQRPLTRKGKIRVEMEDALRRAAERGVRTTIVRAGDFFGPRSTANNWFRQLIQPGKPVRAVRYPGPPSIGHSWAYLPDLGETFARLVERDEQADFETFHFGGHWLPRGSEMTESIQRVAKLDALRVSSLPWWAMRLVSPFVEVLREIMEMRYLWHTPIQLDNRKLVAALGAEPHMPLDAAVHETLQGLGCLPDVGAGSQLHSHAQVERAT